jgi:hypothetical protein
MFWDVTPCGPIKFMFKKEAVGAVVGDEMRK